MRRVDYLVGTHVFKLLKAEQFMQDNVFAYHPHNTGMTLAQVMTERGFGSVPVVDKDHKLIGIVSEFDLLKALMEDKELDKVSARDLMTWNPVRVTPDAPAKELIRLLEEKHLIRMPVVDTDGKLVGVVARRDILQGYVYATRGTKVF